MSKGMNMLYLDCSSGISGDMFAGALLDLGADQDVLLEALKSLPLDGYSVKISRVMRSALNVCDFDVILDVDNGLDHDMEYLYGHMHEHEHDHNHDLEHEHGHNHDMEHEHGHNHDVAHEHEHSHGAEHGHDHCHEYGHGQNHGHDHAHAPHVHRTLSDVCAILEGGNLSPRALSIASSIFRIVAEAEACVHGKPVDEVHFHEVGAVDSIVDIAAAAVCLDLLKVDRVVVTSLSDGTGTIRCQHGILPVPVPAVAQIAASHKLPMHIIPVQGELVTPTGAAIAAALRTDDHLPEKFVIRRVGMGAGKRTYPGTAGFLRAMLIEEA